MILKDTGIRDENGMEPLDNLFSSPEKSPLKRNFHGENANLTLSTSEDMDVAQSTYIYALCLEHRVGELVAHFVLTLLCTQAPP